MSKKYKILSIDGGGIRGVYPAKILANIENELENKGESPRIRDHFNLICGTSTGGILAIGLALGIPAADLLNFYVENRKRIFPFLHFIFLFRKYSNRKLEQLLKETFKEYFDNKTQPKMSDVQSVDLCIPSYDIENAQPKVYKTKIKPDYISDQGKYLYQIAMSTAAAPTYFTPYKTSRFSDEGVPEMPYHVDGGIFANNPTLIGIMEAHKGLNISLNDIDVLSLGTGSEIFRERNSKKILRFIPLPRMWGSLYWITKARVINLMMQAQSQSIHNICNILSKGTGQSQTQTFSYHRVQTELSDEIAMDSTSTQLLDNLINQANHKFQIEGNDIIQNITSCRRMASI